jgi:hypothetical protein
MAVKLGLDANGPVSADKRRLGRQHHDHPKRWMFMHNHMSPIKYLAIRYRLPLTRVTIVPLIAICFSASWNPSNAQTQGRTSSANPPGNSSTPSYGVAGPLSGTAPLPDRPLSGFEQRGVSGIRPGQPGNPLPASQSGGKDGKSGIAPGGNKSAPGDKGFGKGQDGKSASGKNGPATGQDIALGAGTLGCINCATILQVRTVRMKPSPSWMLNSDARAPETANSQNSELPSHGQGTSIGTSGNRSMIDPDGNLATQFGKRMYEVTLMMDSGLTRKIHLDMMPGYNLGSKVRVMGNRLLPR